MTLILDVIAGLAAGLALAWAARAPLARVDLVTRTRFFAACALYALAVDAPLAIATYLTVPDWFLMYVVNPGTAPAGVLLVTVTLASATAPLAGFFVGHRILAEGHAALIRSVLYALFGAALVAMVLGARALSTLGFYEAYHYRGAVMPLVQTPIFLPLLVGLALRVALFTYVYRAIARFVVQEADVGENVPLRPEVLPVPPPATETRM